MGALRGTGRHRRATIAAAAAMVVVGSWFVVSSATGSAAPSTTARTHAPASPVETVPSPVTTPMTVPPTSDTVVRSTSSVPVTTAAPATSAPTTAAHPTAPVAIGSAVPRSSAASRAALRGSASGPMAKPSGATARAAVSLIAAIHVASHGTVPIPVTTDNIDLLGRWMANEGGLWADNPLNTSLDAGSYPHQFSAGGQDTGIPIFPSLAAGVAATATTLLSNSRYAHILKVLGSGSASCLVFARAVIQSPWASGHYDHDPGGFCTGRIVPPRRGRGHAHQGARRP
jgi:hypothetical protein